MALDIDALLQPLTSPGDGSEPRDSQPFGEMEREVDKLSSLSSDSTPNWNRLEQLAAEFLTQQSKDYLVASWLAEAWTQRHAIEGVSAGLGLFAGLTEKFWDIAVPPKARMRGRRNAILWWIDRVSDWLEKQADMTIGADLAERMVSYAKSLDTLLAEKDPESPSLSKLLSHLQRIPVEQTQKVESSPVPESPAGEPAVVSTPVADGTAAPSPQSIQPASAPPKTDSATAPKSPSFAGNVQINSFDDLIKLLKPAQDYIAQIGPALFTFDHAHPLSINLTRFAARASIFDIPPANNGQTAIAPPPVAIVDAFEKISSSKNAQGLVEFCESRIRAFPYWIDLDYHSARGFSMMGSAGAKMREAIIDMLLSFVGRVPGIENYSFSDGMPFASLETLTWIKQCQEERSGQGKQDAFGEIRTQALARAADGQLDLSCEMLQNFIHNNRSQREQFRARLILVQLSLSQDPQADLLSIVDPLIEDCLRLNLNEWEPELASQAWELKARAARQVIMSANTAISPNRRDFAQRELDIALKNLSITDFGAAIRLTT